MISWQATSEGEKGQSGRDHLTVLKVRKGGKGKWELVSCVSENERARQHAMSGL